MGGSRPPSIAASELHPRASSGQGGSGCAGCWKPCGGTAERNGPVPWEESLLAAQWRAKRLILGQRGVCRLAQGTVLQAARPRAWLSSPQSHKPTCLFNVPLINSILPFPRLATSWAAPLQEASPRAQGTTAALSKGRGARGGSRRPPGGSSTPASCPASTAPQHGSCPGEPCPEPRE